MQTSPGAAGSLASTAARVAAGVGLGGDDGVGWGHVGAGGAATVILGAGGGIRRSLGWSSLGGSEGRVGIDGSASFPS